MESSDRHELYLRLLTKYERRLRLYVQTLVPMRADVDDILQDTTILLWKKFEEFDSDRSFLTWARSTEGIEPPKGPSRTNVLRRAPFFGGWEGVWRAKVTTTTTTSIPSCLRACVRASGSRDWLESTAASLIGIRKN